MSFREDVFAALEKIPVGKVTTYSAIANFIGRPGAARAVGNILGKNLNLISVPCHRVVRSGRSVGGYAGGTENKIKILKKEGVEVVGDKVNSKNIVEKLK